MHQESGPKVNLQMPKKRYWEGTTRGFLRHQTRCLRLAKNVFAMQYSIVHTAYIYTGADPDRCQRCECIGQN
jgi:hypothetical protein